MALTNVSAVPEGDQQMMSEESHGSAKREAEDTRLPIPVRQRVQEAEAAKRAQQDQEGSQAKFVRFDPDTEIVEPSPKQPRVLYSPAYAGEISGSPATSSTSRHVRRVVEEVELYDEDELEVGVAQDEFEN